MSGSQRHAALLKRPLPKPARPIVAWFDVVLTLWLPLAALIAFLPPRWRWRAARVIALAALPGRRARDAQANVGRALRLERRAAAGVVRELYAGRLAANVDVLRGLIRGPDFAVCCHGLHHLAGAKAAGRGAVLWISDFAGAGDVSKVALAAEGYRLVHLSRVEHGFSKSRYGIRVLNPLRVRFERPYLEERVIYDRERPAPALQRLRDWLGGNGIVSITASAHEGRRLVETNFCGGRLRLAVGAPRLALGARCPLLPIFVLRESARPERFDLVVDPPLDLPADVPEGDAILIAAADYVDRLEAHVRRCPGAWGGWRRHGQLA